MTLQEATFYLLNKLLTIYDNGETNTITDWVMQAITGSAKAERMMYKKEPLSAKEETTLLLYTERLMQHEPVQYVINHAWFAGMRFYVDKNVLIPRPETEELIEFIAESLELKRSYKILDIGTGSGCIPIAIKKKLPNAELWACDISEAALAVAKKNATAQATEVKYIQADILNKKDWEQFPVFDIIVSNPPYIPLQEENAMAANVTAYEPHLALFVPDDDALIFYKTIAAFAQKHLTKDGQLFFEIYEEAGESIINMLQEKGFSSEIKKDMQGKDRMVRAVFNA